MTLRNFKNSAFLKNRLRLTVVCCFFVLALVGLDQLYLGRKADPAKQAQPARSAAAQTQSLAGRIICVDAGHGGYDGGAKATDSGVWEKGINLSVALKTQQALEDLGAQVVMTRTQDVDLSKDTQVTTTKKRQDMEARVQLAKDAGADMMISIHMNEYRSRSVSGPQVFYRKDQDASRLLAGCMQKSLIDTLSPAKERATQAGDYFILSLDIPSVLVECGFISNSQEEKLLLTDAYQALIAQAIAQGAADYFNLADQL